MAVNLNPGADQTLVTAATRAAMANVPKDLSGTFESMASEYGKTMKIVGESFASVAKEVGKIGGGLVKKAIENEGLINRTSNDRYAIETEIEVQGPQTEKDAGAPGSLITTDTSDDAKPLKATKKTTIGDELRSIRKELSSLYLKTDKKSRARKNELRAQREQFSNDIKMLDDARNITDEQLKSGNVNFQNTGKLNLAFKQGMNAFGTKTGIIDEGEFEGYKLVPSRDKNGKIGFMLKDKRGNFVTGEDENGNPITGGEKPHFVSAAETKNLLEMNMDQKILDPLQKKINAQLNFGKQNVEYMGNQLVSSFRPVLDNETTLRQLSDVRLGDDTKTLREHVNSESEYSAEIFAELSSADLASMGVDEMADGKAGYTEADFVGGDVAVSNFKKVRSATFDKTNSNYDGGSHLKKLTEKHIYRVGEIMHSVGNKLYTPPKGTTTTTNPFGQKSIAFVPETGSTQYKTPAQALADRDAILSGTRFRGIYGDYEPTQGGFNLDGEFISTYDALTQEKVNLAGDRPAAGSGSSAPTPTYNPSDLAKLGGSESDDKKLVKKFKNKYPDFEFNYRVLDGDKVEVKHKESGVVTKIDVSPTFYDDLANFMNNPKKKLK